MPSRFARLIRNVFPCCFRLPGAVHEPNPLSFCISSDCFTHGIWQELGRIQDPALKQRSYSLPDLVHSRWAEATNRKYGQAWCKWKLWCATYPESSALPADPFYVALYLNDLVLEECQLGTLTAAASGITYGHVIAGLPNPMDTLFLKTVLEGAKRLVGKSTVHRQKEPVTTEMMKQVIATYAQPPNLLHHRFIIICLLGFAFFYVLVSSWKYTSGYGILR